MLRPPCFHSVPVLIRPAFLHFIVPQSRLFYKSAAVIFMYYSSFFAKSGAVFSCVFRNVKKIMKKACILAQDML